MPLLAQELLQSSSCGERYQFLFLTALLKSKQSGDLNKQSSESGMASKGASLFLCVLSADEVPDY